jgi:hypothetical protein
MTERVVCPHCEAATKAYPNALHLEAGVTTGGEPFIHLAWGDKRQQMTPEEARYTAQQLGTIASVAEYEAGFVKWCQKRMDLSMDQAAVMLIEIREFFATAEEVTGGRVVKYPPEHENKPFGDRR